MSSIIRDAKLFFHDDPDFKEGLSFSEHNVFFNYTTYEIKKGVVIKYRHMIGLTKDQWKNYLETGLLPDGSKIDRKYGGQEDG